MIKFHKMKIDFTEIERIDEKNCLEGVGFLDCSPTKEERHAFGFKV